MSGRWWVIGLTILLTALPVRIVAAAPVEGVVERVGLDGLLRSGSWTPLVVRLRPTDAQTRAYRLRVSQRDVDGDVAWYERRVTVTGRPVGRETGGEEGQRFSMLFRPEAAEGGLGTTRGDLELLNRRLVVSLADEDGREVTRLAVTTPLSDLEEESAIRGKRLAVFVGGSPVLGGLEMTSPRLEGVLEDLVPARVPINDLPDDPRGYHAADVVVLMPGTDYGALFSTNSTRGEALGQWVADGGRLVVFPPLDPPDPVRALGELLPVTVGQTRTDANGVRLVMSTPRVGSRVERVWPLGGAGGGTSGVPFTTSTLETAAGSDTIVPYVVRRAYGAGGVTWVARLPEFRAVGSLPSGESGADATEAGESDSARLWSDLMGYVADRPIVDPTEAQRRRFETSSSIGRDLGTAFLRDTNLDARTGAYLLLAVLFFIGYWFVAGPGVYLYLARDGRTSRSWWAFAAIGLCATVLTLGVVRLVLRGPPEARHLSLVRVATLPGGERVTRAQSRLGLYVPSDGPQRLSVSGATRGTIGPLALVPSHAGDAPAATGVRYVVDVDGPAITSAAGGADAGLTAMIPYRSTLKKLDLSHDATDVGDGLSVEQPIRLRDANAGRIEGVIANRTNVTLRNIYIAFRHPNPGGSDPLRPTDVGAYVREWRAGTSLDLSRLARIAGTTSPLLDVEQNVVPPHVGMSHGLLARHWAEFWYRPLTRGVMLVQTGSYGDEGDTTRRSFPIMSLFGALPPMTNTPGTTQPDRTDLRRPGVRGWDVTGALSAGALVVIADGGPGTPLPFDFRVNGRRVPGGGTTVYQFVLPVEPMASWAASGSGVTGE